MEILPVLDLLNGIVVRGIAGRRAEYRPVRSMLTNSHLPLEVARALRSSFGFQRLYVADLNGILHGRANWQLLRQLIDDGFQLLVDAGIRDANLARQINEVGAHPIVGLETTAMPKVLAELAAGAGCNVTFSLDLLEGRPQLASASHNDDCVHGNPTGELQSRWNGDLSQWSTDPVQIARQAVQANVTSMIVLDLADVGTSSGGRTDSLCQALLKEFPSLNLICGGGVRGANDLFRIRDLGVQGVLVASALHDGRLTRAEIETICVG